MLLHSRHVTHTPCRLQVSAQLFSAHRQYHEGQLTKRKVTTARISCMNSLLRSPACTLLPRLSASFQCNAFMLAHSCLPSHAAPHHPRRSWWWPTFTWLRPQ